MTSAELPTLVVLAGGLGTRFGGGKQIAELPKIGRTIMELSIEDAYSAGVRHAVLVINETVRPAIERVIMPRLPKSMKVDLVEQSIDMVPSRFSNMANKRTKPWGTGHALLCAKPFIDGSAIVITADDYYGASAYTQLFTHFCNIDQNTSEMAIVAYPISQTMSELGGVNRGICALSENYLTQVHEYLNIRQADEGYIGVYDNLETPIHENSLVSMTCWGVTQSLFDKLESQFELFLESHDSDVKKEYYLPDCIQHMINLNQTNVRVYIAKDRWFGVTYKEELDSVAGKIYELRHG
ncbi:NTP transferase domain-containing protein [Pseudoalteromonas luteoviolacea]|uniref:sugar phosphate nucleotidyltransferase n=1 Tax=Pseudoalteromonas luteoviolacea TaxID=43657 RepID=UPI001F444EA1|nr:sugar phosphate nucleotidyltransferase [Pseudoalteromonas luteoviolacea]MCF6441436.1 NTP transferase domain-containing protein [Pseudoalteromonas luteoviolacea]